MKFCSGCNIEKNIKEFSRDIHKKDKVRSKCKECRNTQRRECRKNNKERFLEYERQPHIRAKLRERNIKRVYKIDIEEFEKMKQFQGNTCKICKNSETHKTKRNLSVDHCHKTLKVRGLLCHSCNCVIGLVKENIQVLESMIRYIKEENNL